MRGEGKNPKRSEGRVHLSPLTKGNGAKKNTTLHKNNRFKENGVTHFNNS